MELLSVPSRLGTFFLGGEAGHIIRLYLPGDPTPRIAEHETPVLSEARRQLLEYLAGRRTAFSFPLALEAIPFGETRTYGQIAAAVGNPKAVRAVGQANHRNPIPIFIPCHRVVGADGTLTGYAGGLELKRSLLELERGKECP